MKNKDRLQELLVEFFALPATTPASNLSQKTIAAWDSLAMVQLIGELQATFAVEFDIDEIQTLRSYDEIHNCLIAKGVELQTQENGGSALE
jgi:acyl carrier protein